MGLLAVAVQAFSIDLTGSLCKLISSADTEGKKKKKAFPYYPELSKQTQTSNSTRVASHLVFQARRLWLVIA